MVAILSPLGLYGGNRNTKLTLRPNTRIHTPEATLGIFVFTSTDGYPATANLLSLDASLAILTRVLYFKVSGPCRRTSVKPVPLTGQTGTHRSGPSVRPFRCCCLWSSALALWINQGTQWFSSEPLETPRTRCSLC
jgi:hypothetical protein